MDAECYVEMFRRRERTKVSAMKCSEIMECLEELSPKSFAESWDNVGLLCGRKEKEVNCIYIALDATGEVIDAAIAANADMLITHHPMIFKPLKQIHSDDFIGNRILKLAEHGIAYYAMHTNFDVMGMADAVADELNLQDRKVLMGTYEDEIAKEGIGRIGALPQTMSLAECAQYVKKSCQIEHVKVFGNPADTMIMAAVCPGAGKSSIEDAIRQGADVLITGDIDHHEGIDAVERGLAIIDAGHYGLEKIFVPYMLEYCKRKFGNMKVYAEAERNPFWIL